MARGDKSHMSWQQTAQVFDERAAEYDSWYDDSLLFAIELAALQDLTTELGVPRVELGVGPGRFAAQLGVELGIDPARAPLKMAAQRIAGVCQGVGEDLPLCAGRVGTIFILFTLCFTQRPTKVLTQVCQALQPGGHLVLGMVPAGGPWGRTLQAKKEADHPFYRHARFFEVAEVLAWLQEAGLQVVEERSSLYQKPEELEGFEPSRPGRSDDAGFVVLVARRPQTPGTI